MQQISQIPGKSPIPAATARLAASRDGYQRETYVYHRRLTRRLQTDGAHALQEALRVCVLSIVSDQPDMVADMQTHGCDA